MRQDAGRADLSFFSPCVSAFMQTLAANPFCCCCFAISRMTSLFELSLLSFYCLRFYLFIYSLSTLFFFFSTFFFFNCAYLCLHLFFIPYFLVYLTTKKRKVENTNRKSSLKGTDAIRSNLKE